MITETAIVNLAVADESAAWGKHRPPALAAKSYGEDTIKMLAFELSADCIRLHARCAFRFARLALEDGYTVD